jgi:AcrR family transcriptional regulator
MVKRPRSLTAMHRPAKRSNRAGEARRAAILDAAEHVFATSGFRGGSLQTIAERVGLTQPGILHHFPTKEHLFIAILELRQAEDTARFDRFMAESDGDVFEALLAMCRHIVATPTLSGLFTLLAAESINGDHPGHDWFVDRFQGTRAVMAQRLAGEQSRGRIRPDVDTGELAAQVLGMWDGLALQWELDPRRVDLVGLMASYLDTVRRDIGPP